MRRLWIIEVQFSSGELDICNFTEKPFAYTNFYMAHRMKREIQEFLYRTGSEHWTKKTIRVREYRPLVEKKSR